MGLEIACILIGMLCGNLGAVIVTPFNLGLLWNTVIGAIGGAIVGYLPLIVGQDFLSPWYVDLMAASGLSIGLMLIAGGAVAFRFRG